MSLKEGNLYPQGVMSMMTANATTLIPNEIVTGIRDGIRAALARIEGTADTEAIRRTVEDGAETTWEVRLSGSEAGRPDAVTLFVYDVTGATMDALADAIAGHACELLEIDGLVPTAVPTIAYAHCVG